MKEVQDLYTEICKALLKDLKEGLNKCKNILHSCIENFNFVIMTILSKLIYKVNTITIIIPNVFWINEQADLKIHAEMLEAQNSQNKLIGLIHFNSKAYYKAYLL